MTTAAALLTYPGMGSVFATTTEELEAPLGWSVPGEARAPRPTVAVALFACGLAIFAWGLELDGRPVAVLFVGATLVACSLADWLRGCVATVTWLR